MGSWTNLEREAERAPPGTAFVFGSGLGAIAERITPQAEASFASVPGLTATTVPGHRGRLVLGEWAGRSVLAISGRLHFYEGHSWEAALAPVRLAAKLGVRRLILTNAAGGIRDDLAPGVLMAVRAHLDWTRPGANGVIASLYSPGLCEQLQRAAERCGIQLHAGVYAAVLGPNYETPAEIQALRRVGADAVGMSTAREIETAAALGLECAAVSCITNRAAGLSAGVLTHEEVLANSRKQADRLADLLANFLTT
jgi:purine-nucleoside phosphorylase